jgi:hypothetical protein
MTADHGTKPEGVRREQDDRLEGYVQSTQDGAWRALTVFGGVLAMLPSRDAAGTPGAAGHGVITR